MQHGWSITICAGFRLASSGWIFTFGNSDFGSVSSGRSHTTTFFTPRFFALMRIDSSRMSPLLRQWSLSWLTLSGLRLGISLSLGNTTWPLMVAHWSWAAAVSPLTANASAASSEEVTNLRMEQLRLRVESGREERKAGVSIVSARCPVGNLWCLVFSVWCLVFGQWCRGLGPEPDVPNTKH